MASRQYKVNEVGKFHQDVEKGVGDCGDLRIFRGDFSRGWYNSTMVVVSGLGYSARRERGIMG